jgi:hypothetical protein
MGMLHYGIREDWYQGCYILVSEQIDNGDVTLWYQSSSFNIEPAWTKFLLKENFGLVSGRILQRGHGAHKIRMCKCMC